MSGIRMRVFATVVTAMLVAFAGASSTAVAGASAGHGNVPLDVAPAKIGGGVSAVTYDCGSQSPIEIVSLDSTITLTGSCGEVEVNGSANTVNLQTVAFIKASGTGNHITWQSGPGGSAPRIANPGGSNSIVGPGGISNPVDSAAAPPVRVGTREAPHRVAATRCGPGDFTALLQHLQASVDAFMHDVLGEYRCQATP